MDVKTNVPLAGSKPSGPAAAAMLAAGVGAIGLGLLTTLAEVSPALKTGLTWSAPVGPLSGKTIGAIIIWLVSWLILGLVWRGKEVDFGKAWIVTLVLIGLGFLGTFPLFYEAFTAK